MARMRGKVCDHIISTIALICPGCGDRATHLHPLIRTLIAWALLLLGRAVAQEPDIITGEGPDRLGHALLVHDLNGDGKAEIIATAPSFTQEGRKLRAHLIGRLVIVRGGTKKKSDGRFVNWRGALSGDYFGRSIAVGDANGDGFVDLLVGAPGRNKLSGMCHLILGGKAGGEVMGGGAGTDANLTLLGASVNAKLGHAVAMGDLDGDGKDELIVSEPSATVGTTPNAGRVLVFRGRTQWKGTEFKVGDDGIQPDLVVVGRERELLGHRLLTADLDGDGVKDLIMSSPFYREGAGSVVVVRGRKGSMSKPRTLVLDKDEPDLLVRGHRGSRLGERIAAIDLDGAGGLELLMSEPLRDSGRTKETGAVHALKWPSSKSIDLGRSKDVRELATYRGLVAHEQIGGGLAAVAMNGKGVNDVVIGSPRVGRIIWLLDPPGFDPNPQPSGYKMAAGAGALEYGMSVAAGDLDGDGKGEIVVGAPGANKVFVYTVK